MRRPSVVFVYFCLSPPSRPPHGSLVIPLGSRSFPCDLRKRPPHSEFLVKTSNVSGVNPALIGSFCACVCLRMHSRDVFVQVRIVISSAFCTDVVFGRILWTHLLTCDLKIFVVYFLKRSVRVCEWRVCVCVAFVRALVCACVRAVRFEHDCEERVLCVCART